MFLVNARHARCIPGRKSDISDAQWLQKLHSWGLLRPSFQPNEGVAILRTMTRLRESLVKGKASHQQRIQKALMQMNLQLHHVVNDDMGKTGRLIIDAILSGERDTEALARLRDRRCKNAESVIAEALHERFREDHLFELSIALRMIDEYHQRILECEAKDQELLRRLAAQSKDPKREASVNTKRKRKSEFSFDPTDLINTLAGVDLGNIYGVGPGSLLTIIRDS